MPLVSWGLSPPVCFALRVGLPLGHDQVRPYSVELRFGRSPSPFLRDSLLPVLAIPIGEP
jgi:hypothetical protein